MEDNKTHRSKKFSELKALETTPERGVSWGCPWDRNGGGDLRVILVAITERLNTRWCPCSDVWDSAVHTSHSSPSPCPGLSAAWVSRTCSWLLLQPIPNFFLISFPTQCSPILCGEEQWLELRSQCSIHYCPHQLAPLIPTILTCGHLNATPSLNLS